jgi:AcrR family transcriptional regulator
VTLSPIQHPSHEPKWRRTPEERPQQILAAAFEVFGDHGLAGARLEDIAKRAGVSKGTIYLYFPNKEALFKEMIRQTVVAHIERTERDFGQDRGSSAREQVSEFMRQWWAFMRSADYQTVHRLVIGELHRFPELVEFYWTEVVVRKQQLVDRLIRRGIDSGEFRPIDPSLAGRIMASMFASHALWCSSRSSRSDLAVLSDEEVFDQLMEFFFHAVAPANSPPIARPKPSARHAAAKPVRPAKPRRSA